MRRVAWVAGLVFVFAFAIRSGHLLGLERSWAGTPLIDTPRADARHHWDEALALLDGDPAVRARVPWKGPGYSWFLAGAIAIVGRSLGSVRWMLVFLGALNCALLVVLARRVMPLGWSALAGALAASNGLLVVYDAAPYFPTVLNSCSLVALLAIGRERAGPVAHAVAGAALGAAALVHPAYLLPAAGLGVHAGFRGRKSHALALVLTLALTLAPLAITNRWVRGQPVLISWNGGINLYAANHPTFDQTAGNGTQAWQRMLRTVDDAGIDEPAAKDRLFKRLALQRAIRTPLATARVLGRKLLLTLSPVEIANNFRIYELRRHSGIAAVLLGRAGPLWWPFGIWAPLAILGLYVGWRRGARLDATAAIWALGIVASAVLFFHTARYRTPVVFVGSVWVASALEWLVGAWRAGERRRLLSGSAACVALAALVALAAAPQRKFPPPLALTAAREFDRAGRHPEASRWLDRALADDPRNSALLEAASGLLAGWGRTAESRRLLQRILAMPGLEPEVPDSVHERLADGYFAEGRLAAARLEIEACLAIGIDDTTWRGHPHYALGLGPVRACWLRLKLADLDLLESDTPAARGRLARVDRDCPARGGRLAAKFSEIERRLDVPR